MIVKVKKDSGVRFGDLDMGYTFQQANEPDVYMKTDEIGDPHTDEFWNAVNLSNGEMLGFTDDEIVHQINMECKEV